jgi:hypothetical protein
MAPPQTSLVPLAVLILAAFVGRAATFQHSAFRLNENSVAWPFDAVSNAAATTLSSAAATLGGAASKLTDAAREVVAGAPRAAKADDDSDVEEEEASDASSARRSKRLHQRSAAKKGGKANHKKAQHKVQPLKKHSVEHKPSLEPKNIQSLASKTNAAASMLHSGDENKLAPSVPFPEVAKPKHGDKVAVCKDTAKWSNTQGHSCSSYVANKWCGHRPDGFGSRPMPGFEWAFGAKSNYPEQNCCHCGRQFFVVAAQKANAAAEEVNVATSHVDHIDDQLFGETASLDEEGYQKVVQLLDDQEMTDFISRVLYTHGTHIDDQDVVAKMAPSYSGKKKGHKTFQALINELKRQPWATNFTETATVTEADAYTRMAFKVYQKKEVAATLLVTAGNISGTMFGAAGAEANLDEAGYQAVAMRKDDKEMQTYIKRVIAAHGATIKDQTQLETFATFYGSGNRQMLSYMEGALATSEWLDGWTDEVTSEVGTN